MLRIPNPVAYRCTNCGQPAVLVEFPTGLHPVHCGTYQQSCCSPRPGHHSLRHDTSVSNPPATGPLEKLRTARARLRHWTTSDPR